VFWLLLQLLCETFLILRILWDITNVHRSSCKVYVIFVKWNLNFLDRFLKNPEISNFMKFHLVGAEFHMDRLDMTKLIVAFWNFANAHTSDWAVGWMTRINFDSQQVEEAFLFKVFRPALWPKQPPIQCIPEIQWLETGLHLASIYWQDYGCMELGLQFHMCPYEMYKDNFNYCSCHPFCTSWQIVNTL
jgi:hypothetical protein